MMPSVLLSSLVLHIAASTVSFTKRDDVFSFHVEHIIALKHGGSQQLENLAYACQHCNLHKGPNLSGIDPDTGAITSLFHPRQHTWVGHFSIDQFCIVGLTPAGRTTVHVLAMNDSDRVQLRTMLAIQGD
jgi:uracil-DNA glycosylase